MNTAHSIIKGDTRYNSGKILVVLSRPADLNQINESRTKRVIVACIIENKSIAEKQLDCKLAQC